MNVAKKRRGRRRREESEIVIERLFIDVGSHRRVLQDRLDFGSKDEAAALMIEIKRLDTDAIAHENELFFVRIPQGDSVVPLDVVNEVEAAFFVQVQDCFGVRA